ncbi:hypothetical protein XENOCAPTIV_015783, partial [Xenoophorus captivus]
LFHKMSKKSFIPERRKEIFDFHDYTAKMDVPADSIKRKEVFFPNKTAPAAKKKLDTGPEMQDTLNTLVDAISKLSDKVDTLGSQMQQNSAMLASITKSVEFNAAEIKDCKAQLQVTLHEVCALKEDKKQMMERLLELERYKRRWNLRLKGGKEKEGENTRDLVADLLPKIIPEWSLNINSIIDTVHRLGHQEENRMRLIIIHFTQRVYRDLLWRKTKESAICKELGICFNEDLCPGKPELHFGQKFNRQELPGKEPTTMVETDSSTGKKSPVDMDKVCSHVLLFT